MSTEVACKWQLAVKWHMRSRFVMLIVLQSGADFQECSPLILAEQLATEGRHHASNAHSLDGNIPELLVIDIPDQFVFTLSHSLHILTFELYSSDPSAFLLHILLPLQAKLCQVKHSDSNQNRRN
jgi:hypothetical protein